MFCYGTSHVIEFKMVLYKFNFINLPIKKLCTILPISYVLLQIRSMSMLAIKKIILKSGLFLLISTPLLTCYADELKKENNNISPPEVTKQFFEQARANDNWKTAFATGKQAQVVFMSVTPNTNPENEIGMETHPFDQVIFIVEGNGKAILNGEERDIQSGDMIFIPLGTKHNVTNSNKDKTLKLFSVYSGTDIPADAVYQKKSDEK